MFGLLFCISKCDVFDVFNINRSSEYSKWKTDNISIIREIIAYFFMNFNMLQNTRQKR